MNADLNCLSHWFPKLLAAGLPVPRTEIVRTNIPLWLLLDEKIPDGWGAFLVDLNVAVEKVGGQPCFLRTGQGSGKHEWRHTCYLDLAAGTLPNHVFALVEWSHLVDFLGLPTNVWAVRELLPTVPQFTAFRGMPICREFRAFVQGEEVRCLHPYWPEDALREGFPLSDKDGPDGELQYILPDRWQERYEALCYLPANDQVEVYALAARAGRALGGEWSVDLLETRCGWYVTDCAVAKDSFHWPGCAANRRALAELTRRKDG